MCQMPGSWLTVRSADLVAVFLHECTDRDVAVHGGEHFDADCVQADEREIIIQWRQPPFVKGMLIRNQVGNAPGEQAQNVAAQIERFLNGCGSFHRVRRFRLQEAAAYTRLTLTCKNPGGASLGL